MTLTIKNTKELEELEVQIMLHINERLYVKGLITEEMYKKVKNMLLTS